MTQRYEMAVRSVVQAGWGTAARHARVLGGLAGGLLCVLLFSGCLAQKADVKRMQGTFDRKISDLDRRERELQQRIEEAQQRIDHQRKEAEALVSEARARLRQDIRDIRGEELPKIQGRFEEVDHLFKRMGERADNLQHRLESLTQLLLKQQAENEKRMEALDRRQGEQFKALRGDQQTLQRQVVQVQQSLREDVGKLVARVDALTPALASLAKKVDAQLAEQDKTIDALVESQRTQASTFESQLEAQTQTIRQHMTELGKKFGDYKQALEALGKQLVQQDGRIAELSTHMTTQTDQLRSKFESDIRNLTAHMATVTTKVDSDIHGASSYLDQVNKKIEEDAQATAQHLAEVNKSVSSVAEALKSMSAEVSARLDAQATRLQETESHVNQVTQSVATLAKSLEDMNAGMNARVEKQKQRLDETVRQVAEVNESVASIAEAMRTLSQGVMERVHAQDERLKEADRSLRDVEAQLDRLSTTLSKQSRKGKRQVEQPSSPATRSDARPPAPSANAAAPSGRRAAADRELLERQARERYEGLLAAFMQGDLDGARQGFLDFLVKFPDSSRAPNAQYWLGECYYGKQQYVEAISAFDRVLARYPDSNKAAAALLKKGYAFLALNDRGQARAALERVVTAFPDSQEARKASDRLHDLK